MKEWLSDVLAIVFVLGLLVIGTMQVQAQEGGESSGNISAFGPRGPVGPDVPLSEAEKKAFAECVPAEGVTAAAVQAACGRARKEGVRAVFLPAGEYVFETTVEVWRGLTLVGEGSETLIRAKDEDTHLFSAEGDLVRFTRLKLQGADSTMSPDNNSYGISVSGEENARIDHCELSGFSYATSFGSEATVQVDHCTIHHNLRDGLGYGIAIYSGAYVLITDNTFSQNRHSLASNGALDWSSPETAGVYLHKPGFRKTHWEFIHNRVDSNDLSHYELCAVDTHPGMDGSFVVEGNVFENLRHGVGIRDGSGLIQGNLFRNFRTITNFRSVVGISIQYGTHNKIPVDGCMPHDIEIRENVFRMEDGVEYEKVQVGKAENITIEGELVSETAAERPAPPPMLRLQEMGEDGVLKIREALPEGETGVLDREQGETVPTAYKLCQNVPNPSNPDTEIAYALPEAGRVRLAVYDLLGRKVVTLIDGKQDAGVHLVRWNGRDRAGMEVGSGLYVYCMETDGYVCGRKMVRLK